MKFLIIFVYALLLTEPVFADKESLEKRCADLSKGSSYNYEAVYGKVIKSESFPGPKTDCRNSKACLNGYATKVYILDEERTGIYNSNQKIAAYTIPLPNPNNEVLYQVPHMKTDQRYGFCARQVEQFDFLSQEMQEEQKLKIKKYKIDWLDTIEPY